MAHSLEARVPYLDHRLVALCARLAGNRQNPGNHTSFLLTRLPSPYLTPATVPLGRAGLGMPFG